MDTNFTKLKTTPTSCLYHFCHQYNHSKYNNNDSQESVPASVWLVVNKPNKKAFSRHCKKHFLAVVYKEILGSSPNTLSALSRKMNGLLWCCPASNCRVNWAQRVNLGSKGDGGGCLMTMVRIQDGLGCRQESTRAGKILPKQTERLPFMSSLYNVEIEVDILCSIAWLHPSKATTNFC